MWCRIKVACASAIRTARAMVEEVPAVGSSSVGALARCSENHSERDVQQVSTDYKLKLPIPMSPIKIGNHFISFLCMTDWATFILEQNLWHRLCGLREADHKRCSSIWKCFWQRYQKVNPDHEIFQRPGHDFSRTCALMLHGDEGRSLRKAPLMVIAAHSILGYGISTSPADRKKMYRTQKLNYEEPTWSTRFLLAVLPKEYYNEENSSISDSDPFQDLMAGICGDLRSLYEEGIDTPNGRFYFCTISVMGDWPFLQKAGKLGRTFMNISKASESKSAPKGICHHCKADMPNVPWTDFDTHPPTWLHTVNTESAFLEPPAVLQLPKNPGFPESLLVWDLFHAWHIGAGKTFLASALFVLISSPAYEGSVDLRCEQVTQDYVQWSQRTGYRCQLRRITKAKLGGLSTTSFPIGAWSKGSTTTCLTKFFLDACSKYQQHVDSDVLFKLAQRAALRIDQFLQGIYSHEVWIPSEEAKPLISAGFAFLQFYGVAVKVAYQRGLLLFQLMANFHRIHHVLYEMHVQATENKWVLNPLHCATQADEDFIGRPSRISRRVSPRLTIQRTLERSLQAAYAHYVQVGALILDRDWGLFLNEL